MYRNLSRRGARRGPEQPIGYRHIGEDSASSRNHREGALSGILAAPAGCPGAHGGAAQIAVHGLVRKETVRRNGQFPGTRIFKRKLNVMRLTPLFRLWCKHRSIMRHGVIEKQVAHTTMATVALPRSGFKAQALLAGLGLAASRPFQVPRCLLGTAFWSWPEHRARSWRSWPTQSSRQARTLLSSSN